MCMGKPKIPKMPKPKDPVLPQQPLQALQPANLQIGRGESDGEDDKKIRQHRSRRKLRITKDTAGVQAPSAGGSMSYSGG